MKQLLNAGSGTRPFQGWINLDIDPRCGPDIVADWNDLSMFEDLSMDMVVSHHSLEHASCNGADSFIQESFRILKPGGSLLIFVPNMRALATRWLSHQMDTQLYLTNVYGPYDGTEPSIHRWGFDLPYLRDRLLAACGWTWVIPFDWRPIEGADIARDWQILGVEAIK